MLDEASLGIAAAKQKITHRLYEVEVPRHVEGTTEPKLWRDGELVLGWTVSDNVIQQPAPFSNLSIGSGMSRWARENLDADLAEAVLVLRRCTMISIGRLRNLDLEKHARESGHCYVQQTNRYRQALRVKGSTLDFSNSSKDLIASDREWLQNSPL